MQTKLTIAEKRRARMKRKVINFIVSVLFLVNVSYNHCENKTGALSDSN